MVVFLVGRLQVMVASREARALQRELAGQSSGTAADVAGLLAHALTRSERLVIHLGERQARVVYETLGFYRGRAPWLGEDLARLHQALRYDLGRDAA